MLDAPIDSLRAYGVQRSYLQYFTSITCGHLFFNRAHEDDDLWLTVLVAVGECAAGGGFAHPSCGVVQAVRAGDILLVNPAVPHCTTEFGDEHATRCMIAVFVSVNALRACDRRAW